MIYNTSCYGLPHLQDSSIESLVTDPPYGINFAEWDKTLPDPCIWHDCLRVLKPGAFGLVFSSIRLMHRLMVNLEDCGFKIRDVIMWAYLNGMPKSRDIGLDIDASLGVESTPVGEYKYIQGYQKVDSYTAKKVKYAPASDLAKTYKGAGLGLKPAYEPIILIQKPLDAAIADNIIEHGVGALNLEETRIPYGENDGKVGHNPHPLGRVCANVIRTENFDDGYDKFFLVPKVRQHKDDFNTHPTLKPVELCQHLVKLVSFPGQTVLDCFAGSGSIGVAVQDLGREFIGYEISHEYFSIMEKRLENRRLSPMDDQRC